MFDERKKVVLLQLIENKYYDYEQEILVAK